MSDTRLHQKLAALSAFPQADKAVVARMGELLPGLDDWAVRRVNPLRFASEHGLPEDKVVDFFLCATRAGLFDLSWDLTCPACGGILNRTGALDELSGPEVEHCVLCDIDVQKSLDDRVETSFTLSQAVRELDIQAHADLPSYLAANFSGNVTLDPELWAYVSSVLRGYLGLGPGEEREALFPDWSEPRFRVVSIAVHEAASVPMGAGRADIEQTLRLSLTRRGFEASVSPGPELLPGPVRVIARNLLDVPVGLSFFAVDYTRLHELIARARNSVRPCLTGRALLTNQTFRELFRVQSLAPNLNLNMRSLTVLFTDLKDSTALYEKIGDVAAYSLIQKHFDALSRVVRQHHGSVVKTMGDAVMAAFSDPGEALRAAIGMLDAAVGLGSGQGQEVGLKIGLHEGPALVINNVGSLDYFGQTVNVAARVQGLAGPGEIWASGGLMSWPDAAQALSALGWTSLEHQASLKGVGGKTTVYRLLPQAANT
ncbi:MAG: adenylate/guanylate cyclase domain-containing protein [Proteobacteria bacterium]|nr:adenylate/guanylate cyclase domain-containing protein [Pseudomonadota bacterium]MBU1595942.1 adenylate/guanylate cyclase domain-containing protein [Pseudomonadota bacterium]